MSTDNAVPVAVPVTADINPLTMSKSQKKRMKQKAAKKRKAAEKAAAAAAATASADSDASDAESLEDSNNGQEEQPPINAVSALSPHDILRNDLISRGYSGADVDAAAEQMWEAGLPYDVADEVEKFLLRGKQSNSKAGQQVVATAQTADSAETAETDTLTPVESHASTMNGGLIEEAVEESKEEPEEDEPIGAQETYAAPAANGDSHLVAAPEPSAVSGGAGSSRKRKTSKGKAPATGTGLGARLEMVAKSDSLEDGIFALKEWVSRAAKPMEIVNLCNIRKCGALSIVISRTITSAAPRANDKAVLDLISAILLGVGADASRVGPVTTALGKAIKSARSLATSSSTASNDVTSHRAEAVADRMVSDLSRAVEKLRCNVAASKSKHGKETIIRTLEAEIESLASSLGTATSSNGLLGLMTARDCHRSAAEKSSTVVGIVVTAAAAASSSSGALEMEAASSNDNTAAVFTEADSTDVVATVLGGDYDAVMSAKAEYESLRSNLDAARSGSVSSRSDLVSELDGCRTEREVVNGRLEELRRETEELEKKGSDLDAKARAIKEKLEDLDANLDDKVDAIKAGLSERSGAVQLEEAARGVADGFGCFRAALTEVSASASTMNGNSAEDVYSPEKISNKMGIYFVRIRNYFKAEADCIEFISNRAANLEGGLADLEREIDECRALGMTTNVAHMTQTLKESKQNISEDTNVVKMLRSEAEKMQIDFMGRLNEYSTASGGIPANQALTSLQLSVLGGIRDAIVRIGLQDKGLDDYIANVNEMSQEFQIEETNGNEAAGDDDNNGAVVGSDSFPDHVSKEMAAKTDISVAATANSYVDPANWTAPPVSASALPKLSWASAGASATAPKTKGKSLVEIQQEEMSAKESA
mmetsp:Transcript_19846/g.44219  ORF Transcript_19846/g.44219 Transcript_19846/m.44219 type:complete len:882 (-) Transcript_19846:41-2686(-)